MAVDRVPFVFREVADTKRSTGDACGQWLTSREQDIAWLRFAEETTG
jgi:hypothetical protein